MVRPMITSLSDDESQSVAVAIEVDGVEVLIHPASVPLESSRKTDID